MTLGTSTTPGKVSCSGVSGVVDQQIMDPTGFCVSIWLQFFFIVFFWGVVFYFLDLGVLSLRWVSASFFFFFLKKELKVR